MYRWSVCAASVRASAGVPTTSSAWAEEGSDAHAYAADCLQHYRRPSAKDFGVRTYDDRKVEVDQGMVDAVAVYYDHIGEMLDEGDGMFIERKFDLSSVYPGCFGTADCVIWKPGSKTLIVIDYKHGAGRPVNVKGNQQLRYYALGALVSLDLPVEHVVCTIVQPRCEHPDGPIRSDEMSIAELRAFEADLKRLAAATDDPNAPFVVGDHCDWCPAAQLDPASKGLRRYCAARDAQDKTAAQVLFKALPAPGAAIDPVKLAEAKRLVPVLKDLCKRIDEIAYAEAVEGRTPPGFKLVDKRAIRKWRDEAAVALLLELDGVSAEVSHEPLTLRSPAQIEKEKAIPKALRDKIVGADYVVKESSGMALVEIDKDDRDPVKLLQASDLFQPIAVEDPFS